jgi:hypothetical protein
MQKPDSLAPRTRIDAHALGLHKYFTGRPCRAGHLALRYVATSACLDCLYSYKKKYARQRSSLVGKVAVTYHVPIELKTALDEHVLALLAAHAVDVDTV